MISNSWQCNYPNRRGKGAIVNFFCAWLVQWNRLSEFAFVSAHKRGKKMGTTQEKIQRGRRQITRKFQGNDHQMSNPSSESLCYDTIAVTVWSLFSKLWLIHEVFWVASASAPQEWYSLRCCSSWPPSWPRPWAISSTSVKGHVSSSGTLQAPRWSLSLK